MTPGAVQAIQLSLTALEPLKDWDQVEALAERVVDALRGQEGLGRTDLARLSLWPARWAAVGDDLRTFYLRSLVELREGRIDSAYQAAVHLGLRAILDHRKPDDWVHGRLHDLYEDLMGTGSAGGLTPTNLGPRSAITR